MSKIGKFNAKLGYLLMLCLAFLNVVMSLVMLVSGLKIGWLFWLVSVLSGIWYSHTQSRFLSAKPRYSGRMVTHILNPDQNIKRVEIYETGVLLVFRFSKHWVSLSDCQLTNQGLVIFSGQKKYLIEINDLKRKLIKKLDFES